MVNFSFILTTPAKLLKQGSLFKSGHQNSNIYFVNSTLEFILDFITSHPLSLTLSVATLDYIPVDSISLSLIEKTPLHLITTSPVYLENILITPILFTSNSCPKTAQKANIHPTALSRFNSLVLLSLANVKHHHIIVDICCGSGTISTYTNAHVMNFDILSTLNVNNFVLSDMGKGVSFKFDAIVGDLPYNIRTFSNSCFSNLIQRLLKFADFNLIDNGFLVFWYLDDPEVEKLSFGKISFVDRVVELKGKIIRSCFRFQNKVIGTSFNIETPTMQVVKATSIEIDSLVSRIPKHQGYTTIKDYLADPAGPNSIFHKIRNKHVISSYEIQENQNLRDNNGKSILHYSAGYNNYFKQPK